MCRQCEAHAARSGNRTDDEAWRLYEAAFRSSVEHGVDTGRDVLDSPGIVGRPGTPADPDGRFLITNDRAFATLQDLGDPHARVVNVLPEATNCLAHMGALGRYPREDATAMVLAELATVPHVPLDAALSIRHAAQDAGAGDVPLVQAAEAGLLFDPYDDDAPSVDNFAAYLGSIPNATLLTAVDREGVVHATAGSAAFGEDARAFFVSTDPTWRGRGVGTAMTAAALHAAARRGARRACLESSGAGRGIYTRLGFETAGPIVMFTALG